MEGDFWNPQEVLFAMGTEIFPCWMRKLSSKFLGHPVNENILRRDNADHQTWNTRWQEMWSRGNKIPSEINFCAFWSVDDGVNTTFQDDVSLTSTEREQRFVCDMRKFDGVPHHLHFLPNPGFKQRKVTHFMEPKLHGPNFRKNSAPAGSQRYRKRR